MSINAYRVIDIKMGKESFNLSRNISLADFLNAEIELYSGIHDGSGMIDVPVNILKKALRMAEKLNLDERTVKRLESDIAFAKSNRDEVVTYYCF